LRSSPAEGGGEKRVLFRKTEMRLL
jgi:hypothetical protein